MTLLIGTVSKNNIVLTSDGLSKANPITGKGIASSKYQKIFLLPNVPIAIAHHGLNILNGSPVKDVIDNFAIKYADFISKKPVQIIAQTFIRFVDPGVQVTLKHPTNKGKIIGFWIAGFSRGRNKPKLYETVWPDEVKAKPLGNLVIGGDGQNFIKSFLKESLKSYHPNKVYSYKTQFAREYHEALYEKAEIEQTKQGKSIFGGYKHQLVLTRKEWNWTIPPSQDFASISP